MARELVFHSIALDIWAGATAQAFPAASATLFSEGGSPGLTTNNETAKHSLPSILFGLNYCVITLCRPALAFMGMAASLKFNSKPDV